MRVVSGIYRHRQLVMPRGNLTRPSKDMVKEALFSALGSKVNDAVVLDLFAGSGALGIEALSRGARYCYFVDNDKNALNAIRENIANLQIMNAQIYPIDYHLAIQKIRDEAKQIDLLLIDPPYKMNDYQKIIDEINSLLSMTAVVVIESDAPVDVMMLYRNKKEYKYGKTYVTILWK